MVRARVASNALKHGLTGKQIVLPGEDPAEFDSFRSDLIVDLAPQGALEEILAEKIVADVWRLRRVPQLEAAFYWREDRRAKLEAAWEREVIVRNRLNERGDEHPPTFPSKVLPDRREAHQAAVAKLAGVAGGTDPAAGSVDVDIGNGPHDIVQPRTIRTPRSSDP